MDRKLTRRSFSTVLVGGAGLATLYACSPGDPPPSTNPTPNVAITEPRNAGPAASPSGDAGGAAELATAVTVNMTADLKFEPANFSVPANTDVQVTAVCVGALPHNWQSQDQQFEGTQTINEGEQETVTINLPVGEYRVHCSVPGHTEAGMVGIVTVVDPAAAPAAAATAAQEYPTTVDVQMLQTLRFDPADITIAANTDVTVNAVTVGPLPHNWAVENTDFATAVVEEGEPTSVVVNLPAGTYNILCEVPGHAAGGMVGVLTVVDPAAAAPAAGATPEAGTPAAGTPEAAGTTPIAAAGGGTSIDVQMTIAFRFEPAEFTIPANTDFTVNATTVGAIPHNWAVEGTAFATEIANEGQTVSVVVNLPAGTYPVACLVPGHKEAGMVGVLTVQ